MSGREQLGPYVLSWPDGVFPLGGDTLALGAFATVRPRWRVCDLGTGSGALLLLLARREGTLSLFGVDVDPLAVRTAEENLSANGLRGEVRQADLRRSGSPPGQFDLVISNPPYFAPGTGDNAGEARMGRFSPEELCAAAGRLLKNGGRFALCWRPERMVDLLLALRGADLEPKRMKALCHSPAHPPYALMVEAVKQGRPGLTILPVTEE